MNIRNTCPDIPDNWKGNIAETCRILGNGKPISADTLRKYARKGRRNGGLEYTLSASGKMIFHGKEVKRFWRSL